MRFLVSLVVQGEADVNRLLYWVIPSLLSAGNLELLNREGREARLLVNTTTADRWMVATPAFQRLRQAVSAIEIRTDDTESEFPLDTRCIHETLREADEWDAALVLLPRNMIWAEQSFWILLAALEQGYRGVHVPLVRVYEPAMTEVIAPRIRNGRLEVGHRKLAELAIERLHPIVGQGHFWCVEDKRPVKHGYEHDQVEPIAVDEFHPSQLYWRVNEGLLVHSFNLHPLLIRPIVHEVDLGVSPVCHPDQVAWATVPDIDRHFVVRDSDSLIGVELTQALPSFYTDGVYCQRTVGSAREWARLPRTPLKRALVRKAIRIHPGDVLNPPESLDWIAAEGRAADLVSEILGQ